MRAARRAPLCAWGLLLTRFACSFNHVQCCCAGSRIFVHEKIYDEFMDAFMKKVASITSRMGNRTAHSFLSGRFTQFAHDHSFKP